MGGTALGIAKILSQSELKEFGETFVQQLNYAAFVAYEAGGQPVLCELPDGSMTQNQPTAVLSGCLTRSSDLGQGLLRTHSDYLDDSTKRGRSPLSAMMRMKPPTSALGQTRKSDAPPNLVRYAA